MTDLELYKLLRPAVMAASGVPFVIPAADNQQSPTGSYASIHTRTGIRERGMAFKRKRLLPDGKTFEHTIRSQQEVTCVVEFFRDGAKEYAANLLQIDKREDVIWPLFKAGLSVMSTGPVLDLTALQSDNYEERVRVDVLLRMEVARSYEINRILEVHGSLEEGTSTATQPFEVKINL